MTRGSTVKFQITIKDHIVLKWPDVFFDISGAPTAVKFSSESVQRLLL